MDTLADRVKNTREKYGISQQGLADKLGVTQQAIQQVESGKAKKPRYLYELANCLGVSYEWLLFGKDTGYFPQGGAGASKTASNDLAVAEGVSQRAEEQIKILELVPDEAASCFKSTGHVAEMMPRPRSLDGVSKAYGIFMYDTSMDPRYQVNEVLFAHPSRPYKEGDFVVVKVTKNDSEDYVLVLQYVGKDKDKNDNSVLIFNRLNPKKTIKIQEDTLKSVHKIIATLQ